MTTHRQSNQRLNQLIDIRFEVSKFLSADKEVLEDYEEESEVNVIREGCDIE